MHEKDLTIRPIVTFVMCGIL